MKWSLNCARVPKRYLVVRCVRRDVVLGVVLESDAAKQEGDDAGHVKAVGVEVGCVRDKGDEARLDLGKSVSEARRPKAIPRAMLLLKERKKMSTPWKIEPA